MRCPLINLAGAGLVGGALLALPLSAQDPEPNPSSNPEPSVGIGPTAPIKTFSRSKKLARDTIYVDHKKTLYCGCDFVANPTGTGGKIGTQAGLFDTTGCGYTVRKSETRGRRLEWEHIVPASLFGRRLSCWIDGDTKCKTSKGKSFKGRKCCAKVDEGFEHAEADLHNLAPSVGELNGDRSNHPYGILLPKDEAEETATEAATLMHRLYGRCNFEVAREPGLASNPKVAEPEPDIRGDVARVWFYMARAYDFTLTGSTFSMLKGWHEADPVGAMGDTWEMTRDARIEALQGNKNPYVHGADVLAADFLPQPAAGTAREPADEPDEAGDAPE